ncbi:glycosyltransferase family A protein [Clostridium sp. TF11-13AC]|uniref:glycosyltransferase family 2 protein n=1 Tax=Clostridium sp. TF11-13AC TaxID=2293053 RepID=UPI000E489E58|nr:glycosyltransferase family A protein [Clostridium sp. TF11-13AC]RHU44987.1 glycosyltransferase family 2 protein [Clostridium sp. TF11-13AC]
MERQYVKGRVSVITPIFNAERYLKETIESVLSQTYKNIEIILVDDCSKDKSAQIIKQMQKLHPEIIYFCQPKNMGAGAARNRALELATGQYVAFLDGDDLWLPEKTKRQIELMKKTKSPFVYAAIEMINQNGEIIKKKRNIKESCDYRYLLHNTIIATSSVMVDREIVGEFRMPLRRGGQDYATWLSLLRGGIIAYGINEALVKYRISNNSLSSNKFKSIKQVWEIQTQDEHIGRLAAGFHVTCFAWNAMKKYFL